jgi:hypothetical protein
MKLVLICLKGNQPHLRLDTLLPKRQRDRTWPTLKPPIPVDSAHASAHTVGHEDPQDLPDSLFGSLRKDGLQGTIGAVAPVANIPNQCLVRL